MARQSTTPVPFNMTTRPDSGVLMSSGRAGVVVPCGFIPLLAGDSCSGRFAIDVDLAEMPRPLLNGVMANVQAWFVPKTAFPQFGGSIDELTHARTGEPMKRLGFDRSPVPFFNVTAADSARFALISSDFWKALGLHRPTASNFNTDIFDAFNLVYNFRLASHSSKLTRRPYVQEDATAGSSLPPAFWPSSRFSHVVPDYERALVVGALDLDVQAGQIPISGLGIQSSVSAVGTKTALWSNEGIATLLDKTGRHAGDPVFETNAEGIPQVFAEMTDQRISITLADIDKARETQAFAKMRAAYAGNDYTGFDNDDTLVSLLMQGIAVPTQEFKRPWLLDSKRVPVGFAERHATDGPSLDESVTKGRASATLSLNVPRQDVSGIIIVTVEVLPERIDERMSDEYIMALSVDDLPNALRDVQRVEPVDMVLNRRLDASHTTPGGLYGYEPMNYKWRRDFTRLGGKFYSPTPAGFTEARAAIWQTEIVDPAFSSTHYLAPVPFPHDVFADTLGPAFEFVARHSVQISGLTQFGDMLAEDNNDYDAITNGGLPSE